MGTDSYTGGRVTVRRLLAGVQGDQDQNGSVAA